MMLYPNVTFIPGRHLGASLNALNAPRDKGRFVGNAMAFGSRTSQPQGYNDPARALVSPVQTGGNIATLARAAVDLSSSLAAIGNMASTLAIDVDLTSSGNVLINGYAVLDFDVNLASALRATANMSATIDLIGRPSAFDIAQEVWNAQASGYNGAGTMGEKVNAAGSAGDPLTGEVENSLTLRETMRLMLAVMTGKTTVSGNTITFRDNADSKNRVTATMSGRNRTAVTLNTD